MVRLLAVLALATGLALALLAPSAGARARSCHYPPESFGPRNDRHMNIGNFSVRNMGCSAAHRAISRGRLLRSGDIATRGFRCHLLRRFRQGGAVLGADIRCVSGTRAFRFSWAT